MLYFVSWFHRSLRFILFPVCFRSGVQVGLFLFYIFQFIDSFQCLLNCVVEFSHWDFYFSYCVFPSKNFPLVLTIFYFFLSFSVCLTSPFFSTLRPYIFFWFKCLCLLKHILFFIMTALKIFFRKFCCYHHSQCLHLLIIRFNLPHTWYDDLFLIKTWTFSYNVMRLDLKPSVLTDFVWLCCSMGESSLLTDVSRSPGSALRLLDTRGDQLLIPAGQAWEFHLPV